MKLYYSTGTCAMSCVTEVFELGLEKSCELVEVSWKNDRNVAELNRLNPLGAVPVLVADDGTVITQNAAILEHLSDKFSKGEHLAAAGTVERAQTLSWVSFVGADLHKAFTPLFASEEMVSTPEAQKQVEEFGTQNIKGLLTHLDRSLEGKKFICGEKYTIADSYLFTILTWCDWFEISVSNYRHVEQYMDRMKARPGVSKALKLQ